MWVFPSDTTQIGLARYQWTTLCLCAFEKWNKWLFCCRCLKKLLNRIILLLGAHPFSFYAPSFPFICYLCGSFLFYVWEKFDPSKNEGTISVETKSFKSLPSHVNNQSVQLFVKSDCLKLNFKLFSATPLKFPCHHKWLPRRVKISTFLRHTVFVPL